MNFSKELGSKDEIRKPWKKIELRFLLTSVPFKNRHAYIKSLSLFRTLCDQGQHDKQP